MYPQGQDYSNHREHQLAHRKMSLRRREIKVMVVQKRMAVDWYPARRQASRSSIITE